MSDLFRSFPPPPSHPLHKVFAAAAEQEAERDLGVRMWLEGLKNRFPSFMLTRLEGGSGFPVSRQLRSFFQEYVYRFQQHGPYMFPSSFNVLESFLYFSHTFFVFDLRDETEHVLRLSEYLDWYTRGSFPDAPETLPDILPEGVIHTYNMVAPANDFRISTQDSELVLVGLSLARHATELSMLALLGEAPPYPSDTNIGGADIAMLADRNQAGMSPDPRWEIADRYLENPPGYARVLALVRFDLTARRYSVRYVHLDTGPTFRVVGDDPAMLQNVPLERRALIVEHAERDLARYDSLFSSLATLMFLPAFFIDQHTRVRQTTFATELHARYLSTEVAKAVKILGRDAVPLSRVVSFLENPPADPAEEERTIGPPDFEVSSSGYWKQLPPGDIGQDESGRPIVGKTWVERTDSWSSRRLDELVVTAHEPAVRGPDPGSVYVMRSGSHGLDLYKIGLTRRDPGRRATELSGATGVPTPFEVLARWDVGDVRMVEAEAHKRLRKYKVNRRREFFRAPLPTIISELNQIVNS